MNFQTSFNLLTILFSGLIAGLLYSYSCSVIPGLKTLEDQDYIKAMQGINSAIQNPLFFIAFMGLLVLLPVNTYLIYQTKLGFSFYWMALAAALYWFAVFGITAALNVPLNDQLASFNLESATKEQITAMRKTFEGPWNNYHTWRTLAAVCVFCLSLLSTLKPHSHL